MLTDDDIHHHIIERLRKIIGNGVKYDDILNHKEALPILKANPIYLGILTERMNRIRLQLIKELE